VQFKVAVPIVLNDRKPVFPLLAAMQWMAVWYLSNPKELQALAMQPIKAY
jgi:hypothetical protein